MQQEGHERQVHRSEELILNPNGFLRHNAELLRACQETRDTSMAQGSFKYWQQSLISTTVGLSHALLVEIRRPSASVFLEFMYTG